MERLIELIEIDFIKSNPAIVLSGRSHYFDDVIYRICKPAAKAGDLEKQIIRFLELSGHQAAKADVKGTYVEGKRDNNTGVITKGRYIKTGATKGAADVQATLFGLSVKWEVKFSMSDRQRPAQKDYQNAVERAGGFYFIVRTFEQFIEQYDRLMENPKVVLLKEFS